MKKKLLIVDDDASVRQSLGKVLDGAGYQAVLAADAGEAAKKLETGPVDLLLLDVGLPRENGWEFFVRATNVVPELPIIFITGQKNHRFTALAAGIGALMEKPLDVGQLLKTIQELLAEPREDRLRRWRGLSPDIHALFPGRADLPR